MLWRMKVEEGIMREKRELHKHGSFVVFCGT